jgi:hypothetical protein
MCGSVADALKRRKPRVDSALVVVILSVAVIEVVLSRRADLGAELK